MPKMLIKVSYSVEGTKGLLKEGGTARRATVQKMVEGVGGKVESFYYAYGDTDAYVIVDVPDTTTGIAVSLAVNASGAVRLATIPLIAPEEIDAAAKKAPAYRAPGLVSDATTRAGRSKAVAAAAALPSGCAAAPRSCVRFVPREGWPETAARARR
jgi:uncharacterized protein with GYD domain